MTNKNDTTTPMNVQPKKQRYAYGYFGRNKKVLQMKKRPTRAKHSDT